MNLTQVRTWVPTFLILPTNIYQFLVVAICFVYLDYHYPLQGQGKKRKIAASAIAVVPKCKKVKVLTHRPRYIEPAVVPDLGEGASSTAEARQATQIMQSVEELTVVLKVPTVGATEAKTDKAEGP
jgi:hypothetical protein